MRRGLIRAGYAAAIAVVALICLGVLLFGFANTRFGQGIVASLVNPLTGGKVSVTGLSGHFPDALRAARIDIRDKQGLWLSIDGVAVEWLPLSLLRGHVDVTRLEAERVFMARTPVSDEENQRDYEVTVRNLRIARFEAGPELSGKAIQASIQGSVHYVSATNVGANLAVMRLDGPGTYRLNGQFTDGFILGEAHAEEPPEGLLAGLLGLNQIGAIVLDAHASGRPKANTVAVMLDAGAFHASGDGTIDLADSRADLDFVVNAPAMSPRSGLSWQSLAVDGHLHGSFSTPDIVARIAIRDFRADENGFDEISGNAQGSLGAVDFTATMTGARIARIDPKLLARAPIALKGHANLDTPARPVSFTISHPAIAMEGQMDLGEQKRGTIMVTLPEIAPFAGLAGVDIRGRAKFTTKLALNDATSRIGLDGTIEAAGTSTLARLLGRSAHFMLNADAEGANIAVSDLRFDGAAVRARISGTTKDEVLNLGGTIDLSDLSLLTPNLSGAVHIQGRVAGPLQMARLNANASGDIATQGFAKQRVMLTVNATGLSKPSTGDFHAEGRFDDGPVSVNGTFGWQTDGIKLAVQRGEWKSLSARANLSMPDNGSLSGDANFRLERLQDLAPIIGQPIEGSVDATLALGGQDGKTGNIEAKAQNLRFQNVRVGEATVGGRIANPIDAISVALDFRASRIEASGIKANASGRVEGPKAALALQVISDLQDMDGNPANLTASSTLDLDKKAVRLTAFRGTYRNQTAVLAAPTQISYANGLSLGALRANIGRAAFAVRGDLLPNLNADLSVENLTAAQLQPFVPELTEGVFTGEAKLTGTLDAPKGNITLTGRGLRASRFATTGIESASLDARAVLDGQMLTLDASVISGKYAHLMINGHAPLDPRQTMDLRADGTLDLAILTPLLAVEGRSLRGQIALNASIGGTVMAPRVTGNAQLSGGEIQDYTRGVRIQDVRLRAESDGAMLRVTDFSGRAGSGTITGVASIDLEKPGFPVDVSLEARKAQPIASDRLTATMDANLKLAGKAKEQLLLSGTIAVSRGEIILPDNLPSNVVVLDVRRPGQTVAIEASQSREMLASLDLTITTPGQFFVRGHGLDAEVEGRIHVGGTDISPVITGGLDMRRGTYVLAGQTLTFTSGKVSFDGAGLHNKLDPTLDFVAQTVSAGVTANLQITGYASAPKVQLSSMPSLPQDEILARLLFNQGAKELTPFQLAEIAQAAASLGGVGTGFNPLGTVRRSLGLDVLSIGSRSSSAGGTETTVEAGKYVTRGVFVGAKQGQSGGTQTEVQVDLTKNLKARATIDTGTNPTATQGAQQTSGNSIGLTYQFEY
ncbi:MAG TPA: translocation/assembly module TamB domain-containing protein [Micropepsaceae bacterium]|nr:translocation/assembly module TamB domain-containing protein [Micropepsaceae bacterium]